MSAKKADNDNCVIKCNPHRELATGYTRVRVMPENYSKIILIVGMTGKTIQDVVDELLTYAIKNTKIQNESGCISLSAIEEEN